MLLFMGGDRNNTEGEQTTKKWEADVLAKRYEKGKTVGGRQLKDFSLKAFMMCLYQGRLARCWTISHRRWPNASR